MSNSIEDLRETVDALPVPTFNLSAIQSRAARKQRAKPRRGIAAAVLAGVLIPVLAAAAVRYLPVRIVSRGNGSFEIQTAHAEGNFRPTRQTLQAIAAKAPYRVILPAGLPQTAKLHFTMTAGNAVIMLGYGCPSKRFIHLMIVPSDFPFDTSALFHAHVSVRMRMPSNATRSYKWTAGDERVRLDTNCLSPAQVATVHRAMLRQVRLKN